MRLRTATWLCISVALISLCLCYGQVTLSFNASGLERSFLAAGIGLLGLASVFLFPDTTNKKKVLLVLLLSLVTRASLLPSAPSDDINRYLWEGKLISLGVSPFEGFADDPIYQEHRDHYWEAMNHRDKPTAYPPIAMETFRLVNGLGYHPMSYKVVFMLLDLFLIATLLALLHHHRRPLHWALFYALSPISLLSFSAEGHFDILMVLAFTFSLLAFSKRWFVSCGIAVGIAVGAKIMAAVIAPLILWRAGWKAMLAALITLILPVAIYWNDIVRLLLGLFVFGSKGRFNGPIHQLLSSLFDDYDVATKAVAVLFILCWLIGFYIMLKKHLWSGLLVSFGSLVILSPVVHFWYLSWILPLIALRPKFSWLTLSVTVSLYFLVWDQQAKGAGWNMPGWALWLFWVPFFTLLIIENRHLVDRLKHLSADRNTNKSPSLAVIIPTYNPGNQLQLSIDSLATQSLKPNEIILVDAGSTDSSLEKLQSHDLAPIIKNSELGRGVQIKTGILASSSDWVVICHADNILPHNALEATQTAIVRNPHLAGGALGQRFSSCSSGLLLVESMNEYRATLLNTSFGDQTQFFHRETCLQQSVLTEQPLMEDVEMSNRINTLGDNLYLGVPGTVSAQKWISGSFCKRFITIVEFYFRYKFLTFSKQQRANLSHSFYQRYYKK